MSNKCFHCGFLLEKKLKNNYSPVILKKCPNCKKLAPRASMKQMNSPKKPKSK